MTDHQPDSIPGFLLGLDDYERIAGRKWEDGTWFKTYQERMKRRCAYCGEHDPSTIDHIIPRQKGGTHEVSNLVWCCWDCNEHKSINLLADSGLTISFPDEAKVKIGDRAWVIKDLV